MTTVRTQLSLALAADRAIRRRAAAEAVAVPEGLVIRHPALADTHHLNAVLLDAAAGPRLPPAEVPALADRRLGDLAHRHVVFDDGDAGERAAEELAHRGWERRRTLLMVLGPAAGAPAADPRARPVSEDEMDALQRAALAAELPSGHVAADLAGRLSAVQRALRSGTPARCFGAGDGAALQSMCTLFLDPDVAGQRVAMLAEVGTLPTHRGRGLARAVIAAAITAARAWRADLVVVAADADDWPQLIYAGMGFVAVGRQVSLTLPAGARRGSGGGGR